MRGSRTVCRRVVIPAITYALVAAGLTATPARAAVAALDPGINSPAALENTDCDATRKQIKFPALAAPACVKPWKDGANNGGATAQGVTKDAVKVVVLYTNVVQDGRSPASLYKNQATGGFSNQRDPIIDADAVYAKAFETWGRRVEYEFGLGTGADEAAQRADAVSVAAKKPFAVFDAAIQGGNQSTGGLIFETEVKARGVPLVLGTGGAPPQSPKEVSKGVARNAAEFAGKSLVGKKAEYGGDAVKDKTRSFGILYQSGDNGFDIDFFKSEFAKYGGKIAANGEAAFNVPPGTAQADSQTLAGQQMPTMMAHLKEAGITTVIDVLDYRLGLAAALNAATGTEYEPEWFMASGGPTGGGAFPTDLDIILRVVDQKQAAHFFGLDWFPPYVKDPLTANPFQWFWGTDKGSTWSGAQALVGVLYTRIHLAGPKLTLAKLKPGALPVPQVGGYYSKSVLTVSTGPTGKDGIAVRDAALAWFDPTKNATDQATLAVGDGAWMYLDGGARYVSGHWPKNKKGFFDKSLTTTIAEYVDPPATEPKVPSYPCTGCPSSGGTSPSPSQLS
ncbi:MAG: hypothetical protein WD271_07575 [Acidimicrobiia bacterium]